MRGCKKCVPVARKICALMEKESDALFREFAFFGTRMDVMALTKDGFMHEFEIKCSKSDLQEAKTIMATSILETQPEKYSVHGVKGQKHFFYLKQEYSAEWPAFKSPHGMVNDYFSCQKPNFFWMVVPYEFRNFCKQNLIATPYGIITFTPKNKITIFRKPRAIHKLRVPEGCKREIIRSASMSNGQWNIIANVSNEYFHIVKKECDFHREMFPL